jgi:hypothetical protein
LKHLDYLRKESKKFTGPETGAGDSGIMKDPGSFVAPNFDVSVQTSDSEVSGSGANDPFQEIFENTKWHREHPEESRNTGSGNSAAELYYETWKKEHQVK